MPRDKKSVSYNMSRIKGKDTSIELILRHALYQEGYRYRKNVKDLPGHPDIYLSKYRIVIFCDGDFFHGYDIRDIDSKLKTNQEFWDTKIRRNQKRDVEETKKLVEQGFIVLRFWEHEIRNDLKTVLRIIDDAVEHQKEKLGINE